MNAVALRDLLAAPAGHAEVSALRTELTGMLRWRLRWLPSVVEARTLAAARLVPVLLHASFARPRLDDDAPGVAGMRYRRSWSTLSRAFDLPPPCRAQRAAPLVDAVVALPQPGGLSVLVLVAPSLRPDDLRSVGERIAAAQGVLSAQRAAVELRVVDPAALVADPLAGHGALAFGALVAGRLSAAAWAAIEGAARRPVGPDVLGALAASAPTPLAALALTLLSAGSAVAPLQVSARLLGDRVPARALADASALAVRWAAASRVPEAASLQRILELSARPGQPPRRAGPRRPAAPDPAPPGAGEVLALGHALGIAAARAIRHARRHGVGPAARRAWREAVGAELPRALLPALGAALSGAAPGTELTRAGVAWEVRLRDGAVLGRGGTPVQARVRALSLLAAAALDPLVEQAEAPWRTLAPRLGQRREQPTRVVVVEPAGPSGPPFDPLNRGPSRAVGFPGALEVRIAPGFRASARVLTGVQTVERLVAAAAHGEAFEVMPARSEAHPAAARLAQVAALVRDARRGEAPVAIEAGGRVLVPQDGAVRSYALDRFCARPRVFTADPDAPDLALSPGERRRLALGGAHTVDCRAHLLDAQRAAVLYADGARGQLREVVFLADLEEHLRESRAVLQAANPGAILAVRLSEDLEPAIRRLGGPRAPVGVSVRGKLPAGLYVQVGGVDFGGPADRSWSGAALALLRAWPRGGEGRIAVSAVTVSTGGGRAGGLLALYARAAAVRRLRIHVLRALRSYRPRQMVRSGV